MGFGKMKKCLGAIIGVWCGIIYGSGDPDVCVIPS